MTKAEALSLCPGDEIKCVYAGGTYAELEEGKVYEVSHIVDNPPYGEIVLKGLEKWWFSSDRFKKL